MAGALQYLTMTRPEICYQAHMVTHFMDALGATHIPTIKHIIRYLLGSLDHGV